jgi:predicted transcriptional regulator
MPRKSMIPDEEIIRLRSEGKKPSQIAKILRITQSAVAQRLKKIDYENLHTAACKEEFNQIKPRTEKSCETCYNSKFKNRKSHCRTMEKKPSKLFCYMTEAQAIKAEDSIRRYSFNHK